MQTSTTETLGVVEEIDGLLALAGCEALRAEDCRRLLALLEAAPGRRDRVVAALARQRDPAAVDALLSLPAGTRGQVEGVFAALRHGVCRVHARGVTPRMLALEFRSSTSNRFLPLLTRAQAAFAEDLERLRVEGGIHYRLALFEGPGLKARVRGLELDLERIHRDLLRLRGVRLWLNGWRFDDRGPVRATARVALLRAWLDWAIGEGT